MAENPKIVFEGKDNITPAAQSATQSIKDLAKTLLEKSLAESTTSKGALLNYEKEIFLLKQKKQLEIESKREIIGASYERKIKEIRSDKEEAERIAKDKSIPREERISAITSLRTRAFEKREEGAELDYKKQLKTLEDENKESKKQTQILTETLKQFQLLIKLLSQGDKQKPEDYKKLLEGLGVSGPGGEELTERIEKDKKTKGSAIFSGVFWGNMAAEMAKSVGKAILKTPGEAIKSTYSAILSGKEGDQMAADVMKIVPFGIGEGVSTMLENWLEAEAAREKAGAKYQAISGGRQFVGGAGFGYKFEEASQINQQIARSRGNIDEKNMPQEIEGTYRLLKGLGLDLSTISQTTSSYRYQDTQRTAEQNVSVLMKAMGIKEGSKDIIRMQELLETQNKLVQESSQKLEKVSPKTISTVIAAFSQFGGSFAGGRAGERISTINQALSTPQGDYQQAMSFATLAQLKPGGSFLDMMKMQEKGIEQEGYMQKMMETLSGQYGTGDLFTIALKNRFNLSAEQAETLAQGWREGRGFEGIGKKGITPEEIKTTYVSGKEVREATLEQEWADGIVSGITESIKQLGDGLEKVFKETGNLIVEGVKKVF
jgi:hypothetical protein